MNNSIPKTGIDFPLVIESSGNRSLSGLKPDQLSQQINTSGVLLLRGFEFDLAAFEAFTRDFCGGFHEVGSRARLRQKKGDGYTSEVFRDNFSLLTHSEGTYRPWPLPPELCFFYCVTPPSQPGGETTLIDGIAFAQRLPVDLRDRFLECGVIYESLWEKERWRSEFLVRDSGELEALLCKLPELDYRIENDMLHIRYSTAAIKPARSGELAFANALLAHLPRIPHPDYQHLRVYAKSSNHVYFGDGEELSDDVVNRLIDLQDDLIYAHRWQVQDLLLIDNTRFMHGRRMTDAPCERELISRFGRIN